MFFLTMIILVAEVTGGLISHSLALLSDAGHVLTDIFAFGLAWFATAQTERPTDAHKSFGYHRVGILAVLAKWYAGLCFSSKYSMLFLYLLRQTD